VVNPMNPYSPARCGHQRYHEDSRQCGYEGCYNAVGGLRPEPEPTMDGHVPAAAVVEPRVYEVEVGWDWPLIAVFAGCLAVAYFAGVVTMMVLL
jgi:hypothetical protein